MHLRRTFPLLLLLALALRPADAATPAKATGGKTPPVPAGPPPIVLAEPDRDWVRHEIYLREAERMDLEFPRVKKGDELRLRLLNGSDLVGSFVFASSNNFTAVRNNVESRQWFRDLDARDRFRLDPTFREAALKVSALAHAAILIPPAETGPRAPLPWEEMLKVGTPTEMLSLAKSIMGTWSERNPGALDPGYAFLLVHPLAPYRPEAAGLEGLLLFNGQGVRKAPDQALPLLAAAAEDRHRDSSDFLNKFNVDSSRRAQALAEGQRVLSARKGLGAQYRERIMAMKKDREEQRRAILGPEEPPPPPDPKKNRRR